MAKKIREKVYDPMRIKPVPKTVSIKAMAYRIIQINLLCRPVYLN